MAGEGYPDIEALLVDWLKTVLDVKQVHAGSVPDDVPPNLTAAVPVVMVSRFGGADRVEGFDDPRVDIDVFASSRTAAISISERIRRALRITLPRQVLSGAVVTRVGTISAPTTTPWDATNIRRVTGTYQLGLHHPI